MGAARLMRVWRVLWISLVSFLSCIGLYFFTALLLGLIAVNPPPRPSAEDVDIFVTSNGVHTSLVLPMVSPTRDWRTVLPFLNASPETARAPFLAIGWGDRGFYLQTPAWAELKPSTALRALTGLDTAVLHIEASVEPPLSDRARRVRLSPARLATLIATIDASLTRDEAGRARQVAGAHYNDFDAFYEAGGHYSLFYTCNEWARSALSQAGVRMPVWSPFTAAIFHHLPEPD